LTQTLDGDYLGLGIEDENMGNSKFEHFFLLLNSILLSVSQVIVKHPSDQYVAPNACVTFECKINDYDASRDSIAWCRDNYCTLGRLSGSNNDKRLQYKSLPKYFIVGDRAAGEWNLMIENVTQQEVGDYMCTLTRKTNFLKIQSKSASLKLTKKPEAIRLDYHNELDVNLNETRTVICQVNNGVPTPVFKWKLADRLDPSKFVYLNNWDLVTQTTESANTTIYSNQLELKGSFDIGNKTLSCLVKHPMLHTPLTKSIQLNLKFAPILSINTETEGDLYENQVVKFTCNSLAMPPASNIGLKLINNRNEIINQYNSPNGSLVLHLNRAMNGLSLICQNQNEIGKSLVNYTLNILYPPTFMDTPKPIINLNYTQNYISLRCSADSNPPAMIVWLKGRSEIVHIGEYLDLNTQLSGTDYLYSRVYGEYTCRAKSTGHKDLDFTTNIITNGMPAITGESVYFAEKDKNLNIKFSILSSPELKTNPACTKLSIKKEIILRQIFLPTRGHRSYKLDRQYTDQNNMTSILTFSIGSVQDSDFGVYNCTVANSIGANSFIFEIQLKADNSKFVIALSTAILFLVLFLTVIVTIVIIMFHLKLKAKMRKKKTLKNVYDYSNSAKNSPNLSVSEWITNNSLNEKSDDKLSQCEIFFEGKAHSQTLTGSNVESIFYPTKQLSEQIILDGNNLSNDFLELPLSPQNYIVTDESKKFYQNMSLFSTSSYQSPSVLLSKFQTNV